MYAFVLGSFGWVKMFSVGPCSINQIEKGHTVGESSCLAERVGDIGDDFQGS